MAKASSAEDYKLSSSFEEVRKKLLIEDFSGRLSKPLAYWALPNDRRLPLAFLGRTVGDLLNTPFGELTGTAGIGQKKISALVKLLHRAAKDEAPEIPFGISALTNEDLKEQMLTTQHHANNFDPALVSEAHWTQWCDTIRRLELGREKLGRLAPTLQSLPTVIWHTPIGNYLEYTISEIRQLKTHGEKRVRVVLEVFCFIHESLTSSRPRDHLNIHIVPKFIQPIEQWIADVLNGWTIPSPEDVRDHLAIPLLAQVNVDVGPTVWELAEGRLGIKSEPQSVRVQSRRLGVTRARVYQLLDDCSKAIDVRWPDGGRRLAVLSKMFQAVRPGQEDLTLFNDTRNLFFPEKQQGDKDQRQPGAGAT